MRTSRRVQTAVAALAVMAGLVSIDPSSETLAMAHATSAFSWEWRADRALTSRAALRLKKISKEGGGFFGIGKSPSLGRHLPDAQRVVADVLAVTPDASLPIGAPFEFRVPLTELQGAVAGSRVVVGIIADKVVCLTVVPSSVDESALANWMASAPCG